MTRAMEAIAHVISLEHCAFCLPNVTCDISSLQKMSEMVYDTGHDLRFIENFESLGFWSQNKTQYIIPAW